MLVIVVDGIIDCRFYAVSISAGLFAPCETRIKSFHGEPFGTSHEDPDAAIDVSMLRRAHVILASIAICSADNSRITFDYMRER